MEEEEEMWFNDEDDFDEGETVVMPPAANDILTKKLDSDLDSIGKMIETTKSKQQVVAEVGFVRCFY